MVENLISFLTKQNKAKEAEQFLSSVDKSKLSQLVAQTWDQFNQHSAKLSAEAKDECYALHQQATEGDNTTAKPGMMAWAETKRQWDAWTAKKGMSKE